MHDSRIGGNMDLSEIIEFFTTVAVLGHPLSITRLTLIGNQPPWQSTGLPAKEGQSYSLFADGLIHWSERYPELHGGPEFHLWARINGGRAVNLSAASGTFTADIDGDIEVCIYMGMWGDAFGNLVSGDRLYAPLRGTLDVIVVLYQTEPLQAINAGLARGDAPSIVLAECDRLENPYQPPAGWEYLHETGYSTMFTGQSNDNQPVIHVNARRDQGILRRHVNFELSESTTIEWTWRVDEHPSRAREDQAITHDYISVATEFDNGRDLTWIWSSCLDVGHHFKCPVRAWSARETHYVVRSQADELGRWYTERRNVFDDVSESMGTPPAEITGVWLIALSTFQRRTARASFADIKLVTDNGRLQVL
jgi:hypothetical protein